MDENEPLLKIASLVAQCQLCPLYKGTTKPVPGYGNPRAEILFIGEAPGYWEDQKGIPFCGAAGNLLDQLLASIEVKRDSVFITNVVKHRPPENREPMPQEIEACKNYLDEQIKIINPKVIITLGRFSMMKFLPWDKISQVHGQARLIEINGQKILVIPMFHPAAALRRGEVMEMLKKDFLKIPDFLRNGIGNKINNSPIKKEEKKEESQLSLL